MAPRDDGLVQLDGGVHATNVCILPVKRHPHHHVQYYHHQMPLGHVELTWQQLMQHCSAGQIFVHLRGQRVDVFVLHFLVVGAAWSFGVVLVWPGHLVSLEWNWLISKLMEKRKIIGELGRALKVMNKTMTKLNKTNESRHQSRTFGRL